MKEREVHGDDVVGVHLIEGQRLDVCASDVALVLEGEVGAAGVGSFDVVNLGCEAGAGVDWVCNSRGGKACERCR